MRGHIRKRGNSWLLAVYLGKDSLGKKKYKYQTVKGTKKEAQRILTDLVHQLDTNTFVDPGKVTFGLYLERWLDDYCKPKIAPLTMKRYEEIVKLHIIPSLGRIPLAKLQPLDLQHYYSQALTSGRIGNKYKGNKGLSPTTVLFHHRVIHKALEQAVKWQLTGRNVADAAEPPRKEDTDFEMVSNEDLLKILDAVKNECPVLVVPVVLAGSTGMRRGEVLGLRWKDFNPKTRRISVRQQLQRVKGEGLVLRSTKSEKSVRSISLSEPALETLKSHKANQNKSRLIIGPGFNDKDLVCCWEDGQPIDPDYFTKNFIKIARRFVPNVRLHDLRHSIATILLEKNVNLKKVSELLGHGSIGITGDIYAHVTPTMGDEIASIIGDEMKKAGWTKDGQA